MILGDHKFREGIYGLFFLGTFSKYSYCCPVKLFEPS